MNFSGSFYTMVTMTIEISEESRKEAIASLQQYFRESLPEEIGNVAAGAQLNFFLEEIAPVVYNKAVTDVQQRLQARIVDLDSEIYIDPFQYWKNRDRQRKSKRN
jgi:uncharacterized protein (DUF2164 family)